MAQSTVFTVVGLLLSLQCCVTGVQGDGGLGEACVSDACMDTALHVCDTNRATPQCQIKRTGDCTSNQDKCVAGAACVDNICTCTPTTTVANGELCGKVVGQDCSADAECLDNGKCDSSSPQKCICADNFVPTPDNTQCLLQEGQSCNKDDECTTNAHCPAVASGVQQTCQCKDGFTRQDPAGTCFKPAKLGEKCSTTPDCVPGANAECTDQKCVCVANYVPLDDNIACRLKEGQVCTGDNKCASNAHCPAVSSGDRTCKCKDGFTKQDSGKCSGAAAMTASAVLLTLAVLVTSRLA